MGKPRGTTQSAAKTFIDYSKNGSPSTSTKTPKPSGNVFGPKSQFKGVGRGIPGDPRK